MKPIFKLDIADYGLLWHDPKGWNHFNTPLGYQPLIWATKPNVPHLSARSNALQWRSWAIAKLTTCPSTNVMSCKRARRDY